jgi:hypothetical protein
MQLATYHLDAGAVWADALFASALQRSDESSTDQVRAAIAAAVRAYGSGGCLQRVAQEFGDHPEIAVARMRWARAVAGEVFGSPSAPARDSRRRQLRSPAASPRSLGLAG